MPKYVIEVIQNTFFRVTAEDQDEAEQIALDWATNWDQPEGAVVDFWGGMNIGEVIED